MIIILFQGTGALVFHSIYGKNYMVYLNQQIKPQSLNFTTGLKRLAVISKGLKEVP